MAVVAAAFAALLATGCAAPGASNVVPTYPDGPPMTAPPGSSGMAAIEAEVRRAFEARGLILQAPQQPVRPSESAELAAAPRAVLQVQLPEDPDGGYLVLYELADPASAMAAARAQADWLGSGPGRVQTPIGTEHVIRVVGPGVVLYQWHPDDAPDPRTAEIAEALAGVGTGVDVPQ